MTLRHHTYSQFWPFHIAIVITLFIKAQKRLAVRYWVLLLKSSDTNFLRKKGNAGAFPKVIID